MFPWLQWDKEHVLIGEISISTYTQLRTGHVASASWLHVRSSSGAGMWDRGGAGSRWWGGVDIQWVRGGFQKPTLRLPGAEVWNGQWQHNALLVTRIPICTSLKVRGELQLGPDLCHSH